MPSGKPSALDIASGFSITGLLDASSRTRERFPVAEIPVADIADHPDNVTYSMDGESIQSLASSILRDGLTDLPLVRKMGDGSWQMISGHRRKAAYALLAKSDAAYETMPCRIIENISDTQAVTLLHTANYFVRQLTVTERAAATRALGIEAREILKTDPAFKGKKADDVKAAIITASTGKPISPKTIRRTERMARQIENDLVDEWAREADAGRLSQEAVDALASMPPDAQASLFAAKGGARLTKQQTTELINNSAPKQTDIADKRLVRALRALASFAKSETSPTEADLEAISAIRRLSARIAEIDNPEPILGKDRALDAKCSK